MLFKITNADTDKFVRLVSFCIYDQYGMIDKKASLIIKAKAEKIFNTKVSVYTTYDNFDYTPWKYILETATIVYNATEMPSLKRQEKIARNIKIKQNKFNEYMYAVGIQNNVSAVNIPGLTDYQWQSEQTAQQLNLNTGIRWADWSNRNSENR